METQIDVLIIGGGAAGSGVALQLGRTRRSVVVIDSNEPRNAPAAHMHGYLGHDGATPHDFLTKAHTEMAAYGVDVTPGRIVEISEADDRMRCTLDTGDTYLARRVVLATGLRDLLPEIDGVGEHWGALVIHCPWCHGWEVRDNSITVIDTTGMGTHQAMMFAHLSNQVSLVRNDVAELSDSEREGLTLAGVRVLDGKAVAIREHGDGLELAIEGAKSGVDVHQTNVVVVGPRFEANTSMVDGLVEVADHASGMGRNVVVDETGRTTHPKIYAVGNVCDPMQQVLHAAADGTRVAAMLHGGPGGLIEEDIERLRTAEADKSEWDNRYWDNGSQMWSGQPNGSLVVEATKLSPGRVLDIGCGEGADAIWLAQHGWQATGTDISDVAIKRAQEAATSFDVSASFEHADLIVDPPAARSFDLVTMSYPALKKDRSSSSIRHIVDAVCVGGHLLIIGHAHDAEALAKAAEHGFDPNQYVSIDDIILTIGDEFEIVVNNERDRPNPPADTHHQRDRVLLARRLRSS